MFQTGVGDLGAAKAQFLELPQPLQAFQTGVSDLGAAEVQCLQLGQILEVFQTAVGDLGAVEVQRLKLAHRSLRCSRPASVTLVPPIVQRLEVVSTPSGASNRRQ